MSAEARSFIVQLLNRNPRKRMGASEQDAEELKAHPFLAKVDWKQVSNSNQAMPEIMPKSQFEPNSSA
jgi:serine/threonine protein kinase